MLKKELKDLFEKRYEERRIEEKFFQKIARTFMEKYQTDTIYFDWDTADAPSLEYIGGIDSDIKDAYITRMRFTENGVVCDMSAYLYYETETIDSCMLDDFIHPDYLSLAEYILAQIDGERYIPDDDGEEDDDEEDTD